MRHPRTTGPRRQLMAASRKNRRPRDSARQERRNNDGPTSVNRSGIGDPPCRDVKTPILVFAVALVIRLIYLLESCDNPTFSAPIADAQNYELMVRQLIENKALTSDFFWQPVFFPCFLTVVYTLFAKTIVAAKALGILLGSVTCVLTYFLGRHVFDRKTGIVAGLITAVYGPLIFYEAELLATGWATFWSVATILLFLRAANSRSLGWCAALGVCGALAVLTRPTFLPFGVIGCVWLGLTLRRGGLTGRKLLPRLGAIVGGYVVVTLPVALQNWSHTGHFGIMPANGGINVYMGNNLDSARTEATRPWREYEELRDLPNQHGIGDDQYDGSQYFYRETMSYVLHHPLHFAGGVVRKTIQFLTTREIPSYEDIYLQRRWSGVLTILAWRIGKFGFPFGVLLPAAVVGLVFTWRRIPFPMMLFLVLYPASVILAHVTGRYRIPIIPVAAVVAAAGGLAALERARAGGWRRVLPAASIALGVALACSWAGPFRMETVTSEADMHMSLGEYYRKRSAPPEQVLPHYQEALRLNPDFLEAHTQMGHILLEQRRVEESLAHYREVRRIAPDFVGGHDNLVRALGKAGQTDEALAQWSEWADAHPDSAHARCGLAGALSTAGRPGEAVTEYRRALAIEPDDAVTHFNLGVVLAQVGEAEDAIAEYREAVRLDQRHIDGHYNLAIALAAQGLFDEALSAYQDVIALEPSHFGARYNLANTLLRAGRTQEAEQAYRAALRINPAYVNAYVNLGVALEEQGKRTEAANAFQEALRRQPANTAARDGLERVTNTPGS